MPHCTTYIVYLSRQSLVQIHQLRIVIVLDSKLARPGLGRLAQCNTKAESVLQLFEGSARVGVRLGGSRGRTGGAIASRRQPFQLPDGERSTRGLARESSSQAGIGDGQQCAAVTRGKLALFDEVENGLLEAQKADGVGHGGAILCGPQGYILLREVKLGHEALECTRLFHGAEILALDIFHQRDFEGGFVGNIADDSGNSRQTGALRSSPAALAGQQLEAPTRRAQDQRLYHAHALNGLCQLGDRFLAKPGARLIRAGLDQIDINQLCVDRTSRRSGSSLLNRNRGRGGFTNERFQPAPQGVSGHWRQPPLQGGCRLPHLYYECRRT